MPPVIGGATRPVRRGDLETALQDANIPVLLAVLAHLTGEDKWLQEPYRPSRTRGLSDHADGGLLPEVQQQVRDAVLELLTAEPHCEFAPALDDERMARIMSNCMGEDVPAAYSEMMREEMGLKARFDTDRIRDCRTTTTYSVVIVGAGVSGLCMAVQLAAAGVDFTIVEKNPDVGGTWYENRYPDCGVDTPSYWYSYSFSMSNWNRFYSKRDDVHQYFRGVAEQFGVRDHIRFDTRVESAEFDAAESSWAVRTRGRDGTAQVLRARFLISAVGQLNIPKTPAIPGAEQFGGLQFHSARWPESVDLTGKKVAVIGTGASAMQFVPAIAREVAGLTVFQRSPQWIAPNAEYGRAVSDRVRYLMQHVPYYAAWYRMRQVWSFGDKIHQSLVIDPEWTDRDASINSINAGYRKYFTKYMEDKLAGRPDLLEKSLPDYPPFGKRMLLDNGWLDTLRLPHVELVTDRIDHLSADAVHTVDDSGTDTAHPADVVVYATGFDSLNLLGSMDIVGRDGVRLRDVWGPDDARAYLGMSQPGFPNLFFLYGPNTNLGHGGSLIFIAECQVRYILDLLAQMMEISAVEIECRQDLFDQHNREIDEAHMHLIWTHPGMDTWYRNRNGRVVTNSPWRLLDMWQQTSTANLADYHVKR
ncbi:hypothetical protein ASJ79_16325 [Mycobacterium sp. NAZ190054]|nr:hypothetical protein ASJ79_16325 [Mycobacterium sp. NAZ190054]